DIPSDRDTILAIAGNGKVCPAFSYDLGFPEVFYPRGIPKGRRGFHAVIGNPPWDRIEIDPVSFFGQIDFSVIEAANASERDRIIDTLKQKEKIAQLWHDYQHNIENDYRFITNCYKSQVVEVNGRSTLGRPDLYRVFAERGILIASPSGFVGWVVPSSIHSNEGATGIRRLYLYHNDIKCCYSFENKHRLFDIHRSFKFDLIVLKNIVDTDNSFHAGFYLHNDDWLFAPDKGSEEITLNSEIIELTGGPYLTFCEARSKRDLEMIITQCRSKVTTWHDFLDSNNIVTAFGVEIHRNPAFDVPLTEIDTSDVVFRNCENDNWGYLPIHSGKTIHQYTDKWEYMCEKCVKREDAFATRHWKKSVQFYRFAFRMKAASTNERTMIAVLITPGFVCEQTLAVETKPYKRPNSIALAVLALSNAFHFDYEVRQRVTTSLSNYLIAPIPLPSLDKVITFLSHSALRLTCNHYGYESLWIEQLGDHWREKSGQVPEWPVISNPDQRMVLRSSIDAIVADAYGLTKNQYEYVLSSFSHTSYPDAPNLCLSKFDELKKTGIENFCKKYDPYWDIPLNENMPKSVIDLPIPGDIDESLNGELALGMPSGKKKKARRGKKK
ncbi:MAG: Eco57I restriction-modification methylase domain-containing protein, partial [Candidatus Thorarchaeota archaeon]